jgi:adenosylhomocysteine nucleosidase
VGDIVVADSFLQHDLDASPIFPKYEVPLYGLSRFRPIQGYRAGSRPRPSGLARRHPASRAGDQRRPIRCHHRRSRTLQLALPEALAVEMEGAAIAQVCHDYGLPFAAVRTISDSADDAAHVDFTRFIQEVASRYSAAIVAALLVAYLSQPRFLKYHIGTSALATISASAKG